MKFDSYDSNDFTFPRGEALGLPPRDGDQGRELDASTILHSIQRRFIFDLYYISMNAKYRCDNHWQPFSIQSFMQFCRRDTIRRPNKSVIAISSVI